jgi:hypothetical protein
MGGHGFTGCGEIQGIALALKGRAFRRAVKPFYYRDSQPASAGEESAFATFPVTSSAMPKQEPNLDGFSR